MKYKIYFEDKEKLKSIILKASSLQELKENTKYPYNVIKIKNIDHFSLNINFTIKNDKEILELFYEISTMLESNLNIDEVLEILINTKFNKNIYILLIDMKNSLSNGYPLYKSLQKYQNYFGYLPIIFFKVGEKNSNLARSINSLYNLLNENYLLKQKLKKAISYPLILLFALLISINIIFIYVIPKFTYIFESLGDDLPKSTFFLLYIKDFISNNYIFILVFLSILYIVYIFIKNKYKYYFDKFLLLHIPYLSNMYRYTIFYKLFLSLYLIIKSKIQFQNALISIKTISSNLYVQEKINEIIKDINNGISISRAFEKRKLFDTLAIRLLLTAQKTNKMEVILNEIQKLYKKRLTQYIDKFTLVLEPVLIFIISSIVLWLVLAIMSPIWQMSSLIK